MEGFHYLVLLILCIVKIESMAIKGSPLTRYDPCGLGVVYFNKLTDSIWLGVLNLGLYRNLTEAQIEIHFDKSARIYGASQNSSVISQEEGHLFLIRPSGPIPKQFTFYLALEGLGENDTHVPTVTMFAMNNITLCSDEIKIAQTLESLDVTTNENKYQEHICGRKAFNHTELISVRTEAKAGDWPWHVAIFIRKSTSNEWIYNCGGSIISMTAVLTACHCVGTVNGVRLSVDQITIVAGTNNIKEFGQIGRQTPPVKEVVCNPNFSDLGNSDLAILKVDRFKYTAFVQPICIWGPIYAKSDLFGRQATVVGFGHDVDNNKLDVLRAISTTVQNDTTCWNYKPDVYGLFINEFTICAGDGPTSETNIMFGDSGGGLVIPVMQPDQKVSWYLRGVTCACVADTSGKCDPHHYSMYTDVGPYYSWIIHHSGLQFKPNPNQQDYV